MGDPSASRLTKNAGVVSAAVLASRIAGFARDAVIANAFGTSHASDAFFVALAIPSLFRQLFAEGSLSAAFIPVFTRYHQKEGPEAARKMVNSLFSSLFLIVLGVSAVGIVAAPWLVKVLAPGFATEAGKQDLTVFLTQIMFPFLLFMGLSAVTTGILNSIGRFGVPALSPIFFNLCIIGGALFFASHLKTPALALAGGVLLGGLLQFLVQLPVLRRQRLAPRLTRSLRHEGARLVLRLMTPAVLALGVSQVNVIVDRVIASFLPPGSVSFLYYANHLMQFPLGMFGAAVGMAALPALSAYAAEGDLDRMRDTYRFALQLALLLIIPAAVGLMALGWNIINVLFEHGAFSRSDSAATQSALFYYATGLFAYAGVRVTAPLFHSMQDTRTPVRVAMVAMGVNIALNLALMGPMKHSGLALATSLSAILNFAVLLVIATGRWGPFGWKVIGRSITRTVLAAAIMGGVVKVLAWQFYVPDASLTYRLPLLILFLLIGGLVFGLSAYALRSQEMQFLLGMVKRVLARRRRRRGEPAVAGADGRTHGGEGPSS